MTMTTTAVFADATEHITELRVAGTTAPKELAGSIVSNVLQGKSVCLAAIGHQAIGQAVKSVPIANGYCAAHGFFLAIVPSFEVKKIDSLDGGEPAERTACMLLLVRVRPR
jgi:stage V sporulation protein SpoVS